MSSAVPWALDPGLVHLNHGSFGAVAGPTQAARGCLLDEMERDPGTFLMQTAPVRLRQALAQVADAVGAADRVLLPVRNATEGLQISVDGLTEPRSDQVMVFTAHEYQSVIDHATRRAEVAQIPIVVIGEEETHSDLLAAELAERCGQRRPLLLVSHVSSSTAVRFPVEDLSAWVTSRGGATIIDGAHGPGLLPELAVGQIPADIYVGNLHKWVGAPRAAAFIAIKGGLASRLTPAIDSWWAADQDPLRRFEWPGTWDPTPWLAVPTALDVLRRCATSATRARLSAMMDAIEVSHGDLGITPFGPGDASSELMRCYRLPHGWDAKVLKSRLREQGVVVWAGSWKGQQLLRLSTWLYNDQEDAERYLAALVSTDTRGRT